MSKTLLVCIPATGVTQVLFLVAVLEAFKSMGLGGGPLMQYLKLSFSVNVEFQKQEVF